MAAVAMWAARIFASVFPMAIPSRCRWPMPACADPPHRAAAALCAPSLLATRWSGSWRTRRRCWRRRRSACRSARGRGRRGGRGTRRSSHRLGRRGGRGTHRSSRRRQWLERYRCGSVISSARGGSNRESRGKRKHLTSAANSRSYTCTRIVTYP